MNEYIKEKIRILGQLGVYLRKEQKEHMSSLKTEIQVDNYAHDLLWGKNGMASYDNVPKLYRTPCKLVR